MNPKPLRRFPENFLWGAATSAYQIEGATLADGAGPSNWYRFSHTRNRVVDNESGDIACDHYNRYLEDVSLMRELGLQSYRFSIAWGRVLPEGAGRTNQKGLDFYKRLVDALLEAGIEPMATLFHWDMPAALDDRGGWLNRDSAEWFADYAKVVFQALDGRVKRWATLNEPWVVTDGGYLFGTMAPGHSSPFETPIAAHNLLRAHGAAVSVYRALGEHEIGVVVNLEPKYPASASAEDVEATKRSDAYMNRQYLDPLFFGSYPEEMAELYGEAWPDFPATDFDLIRQRIDFLGINYYSRGIMKADPDNIVERARRVSRPHASVTSMGWEVFPQGLTDILLWVKERYGDTPLYITENGAAFYDPPKAEEGKIDDPLRIDYLRKHIRAIADAIERGVNLRGYYVWSFLDNFEWAQGFSKRFGIVHIDYETQRRTAKASARFYADVIRTNGSGISE